MISIIFIVMIGSYKPVYEVFIDETSIGFVSSKSKFEEEIKDRILTTKEDSNAVAIDLTVKPVYRLKLEHWKETNEEEILTILSQNITTTYRIYAININQEAKSYVNTWEEAEDIVQEMEEEYANTNAEITVTEKYTQNIDEINVDDLSEAKANIDHDLRIIQEEEIRIAKSTFQGVYFSVKPVVGNISSRFGAVESIRNHTHMGIDIVASAGTPIRAAAGGKVIKAGNSGGYGNLVIIDHGNGVSTYYGHCSRIYVSEGQEVTAGDTIAAVGSTGYSTGNHLHFEIRFNGEQVNPETYIYQ